MLLISYVRYKLAIKFDEKKNITNTRKKKQISIHYIAVYTFAWFNRYYEVSD